MPAVSDPGGSLALGRVATLPFAFFEWCFAFWYARTLSWFSKSPLRKVAAGTMFIGVVAGVLIGQLSAYMWAGHLRRLNDPFLMMVILIESLISTGILFKVQIDQRQIDQRKRDPVTGEQKR
jgi:hypothetical protein